MSELRQMTMLAGASVIKFRRDLDGGCVLTLAGYQTSWSLALTRAEARHLAEEILRLTEEEGA